MHNSAQQIHDVDDEGIILVIGELGVAEKVSSNLPLYWLLDGGDRGHSYMRRVPIDYCVRL